MTAARTAPPMMYSIPTLPLVGLERGPERLTARRAF